LNRVQEHLIGGFSTPVKEYENGKLKEYIYHSKPLKSPNILPEFNNKLFQIMADITRN
jgi:hypothetical protein